MSDKTEAAKAAWLPQLLEAVFRYDATHKRPDGKIAEHPAAAAVGQPILGRMALAPENRPDVFAAERHGAESWEVAVVLDGGYGQDNVGPEPRAQ